MMKKLLKNSLFAVALLVANFGFAQEPVITVTQLVFNHTFTKGSSATITVHYTSTGLATDPDGVGTGGLYVFPKPGTYATAAISSISNVSFPGTGGAASTTTLTFNVDDDAFIVNSADLPSGSRYEIRMFNPTNAASGGRADMDWSGTKTDHFQGGGATPAGDITLNTTNEFVGKKFDDITFTTLGINDVASQKINVFISRNMLNVPEASEYQIISMTGAVVKEGEGSKTIDVAQLASGLYIYKSLKGVAKFVKN